MSWKTAHRSFYCANAPEPEDLVLRPAETVLLCIDVQNYGMEPAADPAERERWAPFHRRMRELVIPNLRLLQDAFRVAGTDALHAHELQVLNRIYCHVLTSRELRDLMGLA